jgi:ribosomal protein S18 acetylase RimI-like enzyme
MEITFQPATNEILPEILEMMAEFNAIFNYQFDSEITRKNLTDFLNSSELGRLWLIMDQDKIAGYIVFSFGFSFEYKGRTGLIDEIFLKKEYRNAGIGKKAMDFIDGKAKELGISAINLEVEKRNSAGYRLYLRQGFESNSRAFLTKIMNKV